MQRPFVPLPAPIANTLAVPGAVVANVEVLPSFVTHILGLTQPAQSLVGTTFRMGVNTQTTALGQAAGISGILGSEYNVAGPIGLPGIPGSAAAATPGTQLGFSDSRFGGREIPTGQGGITFGDISRLGIGQSAQEGSQYRLQDYIQPSVPITDRLANLFQDYVQQPLGGLPGYHHAYALTEFLGEGTPALGVATREVAVRASILEANGGVGRLVRVRRWL